MVVLASDEFRPSVTGKSSTIVPTPDPSTRTSDSTMSPPIELHVPLLGRTLLASSMGAGFLFIGLVAWSYSELYLSESPHLASLARWFGWINVYFIPVYLIALCTQRGYSIWGVAPRWFMITPWSLHNLAKDRGWTVPSRAVLAASVLFFVNFLAYGVLFFLDLGEYQLGLILIHGLGHLISMILSETLAVVLLPSPSSPRYARLMGPSTLGAAMFGFFGILVGYTLAKRQVGKWTGLFLPGLLSSYELLCVAVLVRSFTSEYVEKKEVRDAYSQANQGLFVSMHIATLHAMAEGARMILILSPLCGTAPATEEFLIPICSGFVWNVLVRAGFLERVMFVISCGWRTCTRCSLLLQEVKHCTSFPRYFVILAIALARLMGTGNALPGGQETLGYAILALFIADVLENLCSSLLQYMGYQVFPEQRHCGLAELRARAARRLERRSGAAGFDDLAAVTTKGFREECWKLRARFEFLYGPALWSRMPFWAHLVPTFFAQFHTLLYIICLSNGLSFVLGLCHDNYQGVSRGLLWWPIESPSELCVGE
ncbi:unnamed protein product [Durusdinium trenchii]|uniref:Uncharacterized protein n=1 Tax=Durusdinium trenchii TaxID=1381693 RepID=A0ABP0SZY4_9DINO